MKNLLLALVFACGFAATSEAQCPRIDFRERLDRRMDEFDRRQEFRRDWFRNPTFDVRDEYRKRQEFRREQYERLYPPYGPQTRPALQFDPFTGQLFYTFWY